MAISRLGYTAGANDYGDYAFSVTIDAGTTAIVLSAVFYIGSTNGGFSSVNLNGSQSFVIDGNYDDSTNSNMAAIAHLFSPASTGAATINIDFLLALSGVGLCAAYYSGVDVTGSVRDVDGIQAEASAASITLTTQSGDVVVAGCGADGAITWTNATKFADMTGGLEDEEMADMTADGTSETISTVAWSALAAVVLPMASAGGASIPRSNPFSRPFSQSLGRGGF